MEKLNELSDNNFLLLNILQNKSQSGIYIKYIVCDKYLRTGLIFMLLRLWLSKQPCNLRASAPTKSGHDLR